MLDALPEPHRSTASDASRRLLVDPEADLLDRPLSTEKVTSAVMAQVRRAVLAGLRLRIRYAAEGQPPRWRTVDPLGLVTVRDRSYLLAVRSGQDRTYRLSRVQDAEATTEAAQRPEHVDLDHLWRERSARFLAGPDRVVVLVRVAPARRDELVATAVSVRALEGAVVTDPDGWQRLEVTFQDLEHARWALWQLATDAEALSPPSLRADLRDRAAALADRYASAVAPGASV